MRLRIVRSRLPRPYAVRPTAFTQIFWDALAEGEFLARRCGACELFSWPPRATCSHCRGEDLEWKAVSGKGKLYSRTRVHAAGGRFAAMAPYALGVVDLEEGPRIVTRLLQQAAHIQLDEALQLVVIRHVDGPLFAATVP